MTWQWSKSMTMDGTFMDINGATMMSYTPVVDDEGYHLKATAMLQRRPRLRQDADGDDNRHGNHDVADQPGMVSPVQHDPSGWHSGNRDPD